MGFGHQGINPILYFAWYSNDTNKSRYWQLLLQSRNSVLGFWCLILLEYHISRKTSLTFAYNNLVHISKSDFNCISRNKQTIHFYSTEAVFNVSIPSVSCFCFYLIQKMLFIKRLSMNTPNLKSYPLCIMKFMFEVWREEQYLLLRNLEQPVQAAS